MVNRNCAFFSSTSTTLIFHFINVSFPQRLHAASSPSSRGIISASPLFPEFFYSACSFCFPCFISTLLTISAARQQARSQAWRQIRSISPIRQVNFPALSSCAGPVIVPTPAINHVSYSFLLGNRTPLSLPVSRPTSVLGSPTTTPGLLFLPINRLHSALFIIV